MTVGRVVQKAGVCSISTALAVMALSYSAHGQPLGGFQNASLFDGVAFVRSTIVVNFIFLLINLTAKAKFSHGLMFVRLPMNVLGLYVFVREYFDPTNEWSTAVNYSFWCCFILLIVLDVVLIIRRLRKIKRSS